ncbi:MAG: hypothetical protein WBN94_09905 [Methanothrix sp.]
MSADSERFCKFWQQKPDTPEGKLASAYTRAQADFESKQSGLTKYIRPKKTTNGLIAVFVDGAEEVVAQIEESEKHVLEVSSDIEAFLGFSGGEMALSALADHLIRARRQLADANMDARHALERAIRMKTALSAREAEGLPEVQATYDRRDRLQAELGPNIKELERKLASSKAILQKYE